MKRSFNIEVLWCPNASKTRRVAAGGSRRTGWVFPLAVERHLVASCAGLTTLYLLGGRSSWGVRLDIDPSVCPDVVGDAWVPPFGRDSFDVVVLDPPYFHLNAQLKSGLFRAAAWIARKRVIWFSTVWMAASDGLSTEAAWLVRVGDSCQIRCLQYFRIREKLGPVRHFKRGPAIRYNRWLQNPHGFPFLEGMEIGSVVSSNQKETSE